ncbi:MAG TPA: PEP-CTERM sorting domain-containing protein [Tepidisphaeraceae bacterium]|nr:PEP-CTERM sorting domain-containing protein [Tepidisphaeraceae bacterium]
MQLWNNGIFGKACMAAVAVMCGAAVESASAATLVTYDFGPVGSGTLNATQTDNSLVTSAGPITVTGGGGSTGFRTNNDDVNLGTAAYSPNVYRLDPTDTAVDTTYTSYLQFTLDPVASGVDLETFVFDAARGGTTGTRTFNVLYSFDNFATAGTSASGGNVTLSSNGYNYNRYTYDLSDEAGQATTSNITFRIAGQSSGGTPVAFDNIMVTGSAVPEPASLGLLGVAGLGLSRRRR